MTRFQIISGCIPDWPGVNPLLQLEKHCYATGPCFKKLPQIAVLEIRDPQEKDLAR
jgi:hypothetical protein